MKQFDQDEIHEILICNDVMQNVPLLHFFYLHMV